MTIFTGRRWLVFMNFLISTCSPVALSAEKSVNVNILNFQLICERTECRTPVLEVHENTGIEANSVEYAFPAPAGITLEDAHTTGIEVEGSGDTHYVRALVAGPSWLKCKWLAKARPSGDVGLAKGYCWIGIKKS